MCSGNLTKEELVKILQTVREVEQNDPGRGISILVKVNYMSKEELGDVLKEVHPAFSTVQSASAPQWAESSYQPV